MGTVPTKASDNVYCLARLEASKYSERLKSREGAAELLGISPSSLSDYELGITKTVPVDKVVLMADLYNAPELCNRYCTTDCPIGCRDFQLLEVAELDRLTIKALLALQNAPQLQAELIAIAGEGKVTGERRQQLETVLAKLEAVGQSAQELKLWAKKNM